MHWKDLKTFAVAVLLIVDTVFALFIFNHWYTDRYYRDSLIDSALSVFEESGLRIERSFLEKKKERFPVYMGFSGKEGLSEMAVRLGASGYLPQTEENGIFLTGNEDMFFFGYDFSFSYHTAGVSEKTSEMLTEEWKLLDRDESEKNCAQIGFEFLKKLLPKDEKNEYDIVCLGVYGLGEERIALFCQSVNRIRTENLIYCRISDGEVCAADGVFFPIAPRERQKAENIGLCNLFFEEKAYIDSLDATERKPLYTVTEISYSYGAYFDEDAFYLIPLCRIVYGDGDSRIYNFISGELYTQ